MRTARVLSPARSSPCRRLGAVGSSPFALPAYRQHTSSEERPPAPAGYHPPAGPACAQLEAPGASSAAAVARSGGAASSSSAARPTPSWDDGMEAALAIAALGGGMPPQQMSFAAVAS